MKGVEIWFRQNTILYRDEGFLAATPGQKPIPRDLSLNPVHPTLYAKAREPRLSSIVRMTVRLVRRTSALQHGPGWN
jgi:hypothetical protein